MSGLSERREKLAALFAEGIAPAKRRRRVGVPISEPKLPALRDVARCLHCEAMEDRVYELEQMLADAMGGQDEEDARSRLKIALRLTSKEVSLLSFMMRRTIVSKESAMTAMYGGRDEPDLKIVDVFVCKIRAKLPPGLNIHTQWGSGYYLDAATKRALQAIAEGKEADAPASVGEPQPHVAPAEQVVVKIEEPEPTDLPAFIPAAKPAKASAGRTSFNIVGWVGKHGTNILAGR